MDAPLALHARKALESGRDNHYIEMTFAAGASSGVSGMPRGVVNDLQSLRRKGLSQLSVDALRYLPHSHHPSILECHTFHRILRVMSGAFQYKPKFVDIRVRPPKEGEAEAEKDVHALKPGERPCDHAGCRNPAATRAPKSRDMLNEHYWFCQAHAAEYNRSWDFFAGMNESQIRAEQVRRQTEDRPTWQFKASRFAREAASFSRRAGTGQGYADPLGVFGGKAQPQPQPARRLGRLERMALADLDLDDNAEGAVIRTRYAELVKRCHPDANGGDRSAEARLQRVIKAYKTLQKAKLV